MPFIATPSAAKVAIEGLWSNQNVAQTFWFGLGTTPLLADLQALADDVRTSFDPSMAASQSNVYATTRVTATGQNTSSDPQAVSTPSAPRVGSGSGTSVPLNAAWAFSYRTLLRGRNYRGRGYMPGLLTSILTSPGIGNLATLAGIAGNYVTHFVTSPPSGWTWGVASHFLNNNPRAQGILTEIVAVSVDTLLDSMRRRLVGRGA